jgi:hypothetical protein
VSPRDLFRGISCRHFACELTSRFVSLISERVLFFIIMTSESVLFESSLVSAGETFLESDEEAVLEMRVWTFLNALKEQPPLLPAVGRSLG